MTYLMKLQSEKAKASSEIARLQALKCNNGLSVERACDEAIECWRNYSKIIEVAICGEEEVINEGLQDIDATH